MMDTLLVNELCYRASHFEVLEPLLFLFIRDNPWQFFGS